MRRIGRIYTDLSAIISLIRVISVPICVLITVPKALHRNSIHLFLQYLLQLRQRLLVLRSDHVIHAHEHLHKIHRVSHLAAHGPFHLGR